MQVSSAVGFELDLPAPQVESRPLSVYAVLSEVAHD
jgi:hypothetical protein